MKKLLIILMTVTVTANAGSVNLEKGSQAPFSGVLVDSKTIRSMRVDLIKGDAYKAQNESLEKSIKLHQLSADISEKQIDLLTQSNDRMADRLSKTTDLSSWERILWFGAGVLATSLAIKGAGELVK